ncbi:helix-turn-helix transcriptional regulator [Nocardioides astragali]|uniref:Helix-turn-helix transcriptional regulator n=1 Tax=Nocardioides astragali TaxID=1776736 RepID=A0ABW2MWG9_9ACTN|nr:helix-turn-helix transcriptional regulator [Nocardioides astragali]
MPDSRSRRGSPAVFGYEGVGDDARQWLDIAYGTTLRLTGPLGMVRHHRVDHGSVAFDHLRIEARFTWDADPMPALVVVDMLNGMAEYTRDGVTDRIHDGDTVLMSGWDMPFSGLADHIDVRGTSLTAEALAAAVDDVDPDYPWQDLAFTSYVPHSPAAGARWRATVDELSSSFPDEDDPVARDEAVRLLGHTLLQTFPNTLVAGGNRLDTNLDAGDEMPSTLRRALHAIESHAFEGLSVEELARECEVTPRALQYAFRRHLGCTPLAYLRRVRLDLVRQSLRDGTSPTVSDAAAKYGFFNPGRFASEYRQVFDENPRQTLDRSNA